MPPLAHRPAARRAFVLLSVVVLAAVASGVPRVRHALLRGAGHALVVNEAAGRADVIVISADANGAGVLEAADLVREGVATRVALFLHEPDRASLELARRGAPTVDPVDLSIQQLRSLGVRVTIDQIPGVVGGTTDEGRMLGTWCRDQGIHSMVFVSTADHSRRTRRVLNRSLRAYGTRVIVHYSRYSEFDPDTWWQTRAGRRTELTESQKLLLDILRHPFS